MKNPKMDQAYPTYVRGEIARYLGSTRQRLSAIAPVVGLSVKTMYMRYNAPEQFKLYELERLGKMVGVDFLAKLPDGYQKGETKND